MRHVPGDTILPNPADVQRLKDDLERWDRRRQDLYGIASNQNLWRAINYLERYRELIESIQEIDYDSRQYAGRTMGRNY